MKIIPAIDILNGKCVRLTKGDFNTGKVYYDDPVDAAMYLADAGFNYLHLVDLDGARAGKVLNCNVLEKIASATAMQIDFSGGIKTTGELQMVFNSGAVQAAIGSAAVKTPALFVEWLDLFGADKMILAADCKKNIIATDGWENTSSLEAVTFIKDWFSAGVENIMCTDIEKDGMLKGPATELYQEILKAAPVKLIASGGISSAQDLKILKSLGCSGAVIGKALYEKSINLKELLC